MRKQPILEVKVKGKPQLKQVLLSLLSFFFTFFTFFNYNYHHYYYCHHHQIQSDLNLLHFMISKESLTLLKVIVKGYGEWT